MQDFNVCGDADSMRAWALRGNLQLQAQVRARPLTTQSGLGFGGDCDLHACVNVTFLW